VVGNRPIEVTASVGLLWPAILLSRSPVSAAGSASRLRSVSACSWAIPGSGVRRCNAAYTASVDSMPVVSEIGSGMLNFGICRLYVSAVISAHAGCLLGQPSRSAYAFGIATTIGDRAIICPLAANPSLSAAPRFSHTLDDGTQPS
jgi:hypothetical protein